MIKITASCNAILHQFRFFKFKCVSKGKDAEPSHAENSL